MDARSGRLGVNARALVASVVSLSNVQSSTVKLAVSNVWLHFHVYHVPSLTKEIISHFWCHVDTNSGLLGEGPVLDPSNHPNPPPNVDFLIVYATSFGSEDRPSINSDYIAHWKVAGSWMRNLNLKSFFFLKSPLFH